MYICSQGEYFIREIWGKRSHKTLKGRDGNKEMKKTDKIQVFSCSQFNLSEMT